MGARRQKAVMIATGAFEAYLHLNRDDFRSTVFRLPEPGPNEQPYASNYIDSVPEVGIGGGGGTFGILRASPHADVALDFLRYLTSQTLENRRILLFIFIIYSFRRYPTPRMV